MCKVKTPPPPAGAPAPPEESAEVKQVDPLNNSDPNAINNAKRKGRSALRIPLNSGGGGLHIPVN